MTRWTAVAAERPGAGDPADTVTLDHEARFLRRRRLTTDGGGEVMVDLPEALSLQDGDALVATDGSRIAVRAAKEPLLEVAAGADALARLAWHIGNRHVPAEIGGGRLRIRADGVLADLLRRLGAEPVAVSAAFRPEGGAYGAGRTHGHHHGGSGAADASGHSHD